jgi:MFS family permease
LTGFHPSRWITQRLPQVADARAPTTATHLTFVGSSYNLFSGSHVFDNRGEPLSRVKKENMLQESREKAKRAWVLVLAALASFMVSLDALVVATALSTIHRDLGVSIEALDWIVNAYTLSFAVLLITAAALGDRFGRRRMFVVGRAIFVASSAACALSRNVAWLIAARAVQGSGAALALPLALTQVSAAFPPELRGRALGIFSSVSGLAVLSGPVLGGAIAQGLAWQWIFWLNVPIGLVVIVLVISRMQESFGPRPALDIGGLLLVTGAALGLVWGAGAREQCWLGQPGGGRNVGGWGSADDCLRRLGATGGRADALFPFPRLLGGQQLTFPTPGLVDRCRVLSGAVLAC